MTPTERILALVATLSQEDQEEVLAFAEFLRARYGGANSARLRPEVADEGARVEALVLSVASVGETP